MPETSHVVYIYYKYARCFRRCRVVRIRVGAVGSLALAHGIRFASSNRCLGPITECHVKGGKAVAPNHGRPVRPNRPPLWRLGCSDVPCVVSW